ncbi:hypothetical protein [Victivallis sp. Marseille-Q1083]|uniref:hypothetical protein n=1 Tax=Victivallis sp. Marseille-Q1083 TaxID=2717288 RepID=UPI00158DBA3C|nr:hypothetical protein [Victivallis sp. Marseille-Q1083]
MKEKKKLLLAAVLLLAAAGLTVWHLTAVDMPEGARKTAVSDAEVEAAGKFAVKLVRLAQKNKQRDFLQLCRKPNDGEMRLFFNGMREAQLPENPVVIESGELEKQPGLVTVCFANPAGGRYQFTFSREAGSPDGWKFCGFYVLPGEMK